MSEETSAFKREEPVKFDDVPGFVVLLDQNLNEVVSRQDARLSWQLLPNGASYQIISPPHEFDLTGQSKAIYYLAVGAGDYLMSVSPVIGAPVRTGILTVGRG